MADDDMPATLVRWSSELRILHVTHNVGGDQYTARSRLIGLASAALATISGTAIFATISSSTNTTLRVTAAILSLIAAALGTMQMISGYPQLAQSHRDAAVRYATLRRRVAQLLAAGGIAPRDLHEVSDTWREIESAAPQLTGFTRRRARRELDHSDRRGLVQPGPPHQPSPARSEP